ncbi:MAG: filamentous hemagglutinin N-terminal domain-containing protein [Nostocales cyanobacterium]|nr:MAG: filamentous hemagglutinin N-terminal domain-containing protein [Nostocales cyanobacterium]
MSKNNNTIFKQIKIIPLTASQIFAPAIYVIIITINPALAQIQPDATLGNESSRVTSDFQVKALPAELIEGGAKRGSSLFHSFSEFNVKEEQRVYFANPSGVNNIFSRVTGGSISNILGTLGVDGNANLYLLNPNGIIFGQNAKLDIQGAFFATTANSFKSADGNEFSATNPQIPLLTMSVPVGVQFGLRPGDISSQGNLVTKNNLILNGGNLDLQGEVRAGGNVTLAATKNINFDLISTTPNSGNAGYVNVAANGDIIGNLISAASFKSDSNNGSSGNISLISQQGKVVINGGIYKGTNTVKDKDRYFALGTFLDNYSSDTNHKAGNITIQANKDIDIGSNLKSPPSGAINASVLTKSENANAGNSGTIQLISTSGNITVNGGIFTNSTAISGNSSESGDIILTAKQGAITVYPNGGGAIVTKSIANDHGKTSNAGSITLDGREITINGEVTTTSNQTGNAGSISFTSQTPLTLTELTIGTDAKNGNSGDVEINAPSITLDNTQISAKTSGTGKPGNILLTADRDVSLVNNSQITSDAENDKYEDFEIQIPELLLKQQQKNKRQFNNMLAFIAGISLVVGGIGIMNIMLASVMERIKEIGLRQSLGATRLDISLQFISEAVTISISGGILGVLLGIGFCYLIESAMNIKTIITPLSVFISFTISIVVGLISGIAPARRASKQDPVQSLRHE